MKKLHLFIFVFVLVVLFFSITIKEPNVDISTLQCLSGFERVKDISSLMKTPPQIQASAAILYDPKAQTILYAKNAHKERAPASTTKIMTAILTLERSKLDETVTVSKTAARIGGSQAGLKEGEIYTVGELLWALLLLSGNDASIALAEHVSGSVKDFCLLMNKRAKELGCTNTNFINPHGLSDKEHYSSVADLALIAAHALKYPLFQEIVSSKEKEISWSQSFAKYLKNTNKLLWLFEGADGVKTGTTNMAGACLVSSATKDGRQLIAVVLNSRNRWVESARLLQWGFDNTQSVLLVAKAETIPDIFIKKARKLVVGYVLDDIWVAVPKGVKPFVDFVPYQLEAPIKKDQLLGFIKYGTTVDHTKQEAVYSLEKVKKRLFF